MGRTIVGPTISEGTWVEIRRLNHSDLQMLVDSHEVFDDPVVAVRVREFLTDSHHHLFAAIHEESLIGFASAMHYLHPDKKNPEMWINEIGVIEQFRRKGVARQLISAVQAFAKESNCREVWVLTEPDNVAALKLYESVKQSTRQDVVMFTLPVDGDQNANIDSD